MNEKGEQVLLSLKLEPFVKRLVVYSSKPVIHLVENRAHRVYSVDDPARGKLAKTGYKVLRESQTYSLLEIDLLTGRRNQIRVHLSDRGCPVVGDKKYGEKGKGIKRLTLHAASIAIVHPYSGEKMTFTTKVPAYFKALMNT